MKHLPIGDVCHHVNNPNCISTGTLALLKRKVQKGEATQIEIIEAIELVEKQLKRVTDYLENARIAPDGE